MQPDARAHVAQGKGRASRKVEALQLAAREEGEGPAVGRPQGGQRAFGSLERPGLHGGERPKPQPGDAGRVSRDERELRAVRRKGQGHRLHRVQEGAARGRGHREPDRPGQGRRGSPVGAGGPPRATATASAATAQGTSRPRTRGGRTRGHGRRRQRSVLGHRRELKPDVAGRLPALAPGPWPGRCERAGRARAGSSAAARTSPSARPPGWPRRARPACFPRRPSGPWPSRRAPLPGRRCRCGCRPPCPRSARAPCTGSVPSRVPSCVRSRGACGGLELARVDSAEERSDRLRQAEVEELHARLRQHHVAGLQVAVNDPLAVRLVQGIGDLDAAAQRLVERQGTLPETILERFALEQLHHQEVRLVLATDVEERADVRVREPGDRPRLPLESLACFGRRGPVRGQDLHRDRAIEAGVARLVDLAHAARSERREDLVRPEARTGGQAHGFRRRCAILPARQPKGLLSSARRSARGRARPGALPAPAAADAPGVGARAEGLRPAGAPLLARAGRPRHVGRRARPPRGEPGRPRRRSPRADGPERPAVVARGRAFHRAEDGAGQRPPHDPAALHRHADRGLQRGVEPGAAPGREPARVRQGLDADRRRAGGRAARKAGRPRPRRHDPRPERGLRPRRRPLARGAVLDRLDEGRAGGGRGPARARSRTSCGACATSTSARPSPTR